MMNEKRRTTGDRLSTLIDLVAQVAQRAGRVELYPVADGDEMKQQKGLIELPVDSLAADRFFFNERFMHVVASP